MPTKYSAKPMNDKGVVEWTDEENAIWHDLITRQRRVIQDRACQDYLDGLDALNLPDDRVPQLSEVSSVLKKTTGWEVAWVPALIPFSTFFELLANKKFPCATFIRSREEFDYLQEPDIFHEIFGHTPLLTNPYFADFTEHYGRLGLAASKEDRVFLARMYWFTVEFGLIQRPEGLRIYGGGILSSPGETIYALDSDKPERQPFDLMNVLRTPYRIDIMQPIYFVIEEMRQLYEIAQMDIMAYVEKAKALGLFPPKFPPKTSDAGGKAAKAV
jgi:phenylalanine-4-hydroxylase